MAIATKTLATGMLLGACSLASAVPVLSVSSEGSLATGNAQTSFLGTLQGGYLTEDFESFANLTGVNAVGEQNTTIGSTGIADFTMDVPGSNAGACSNGYVCSDGLAVLDSLTSPFNGRFSVPNPGSDNWLDSMDAKEMTIAVESGYNALGFFMTDPNDAGGRFDIGGFGFDFINIFGSGLGSGKQFYISIYDAEATTLAAVTISSNANNDGFGIDQVTVGKVPEPGTLALLSLGLAGLGIARRRTHS